MQHLIDKLGGDISIHAPRTGSDRIQDADYTDSE